MARGRPFPKNTSGNPKGRPKLSAEVSAFRKMSQEAFLSNVAKFSNMTKAELRQFMVDETSKCRDLMAGSLVKLSAEGCEWALKLFLDRVHGKVRDELEDGEVPPDPAREKLDEMQSKDLVKFLRQEAKRA